MFDALSRHFRLSEMINSATARRDPKIWKEQCDPPERVVHQLELLCRQILDPVREAFDWPIIVNSGYRCPALNAAVGGSSRSQHMWGMAADIKLAPGWKLENAPDQIRKGRVRELLPDSAPPMAWLFAELATEEPALDPANGTVKLYPADQLIHEYGAFPTPAWVHVSHSGAPRGQVLAATAGHGYIRCGSYRELWREMEKRKLVQI